MWEPGPPRGGGGGIHIGGRGGFPVSFMAYGLGYGLCLFPRRGFGYGFEAGAIRVNH
jgi:hypothetical protein